MKIKQKCASFCLTKRTLIILMRTFIFLCFTTVFSFTPSTLISQNYEVKIDKTAFLTVDQVFDLIMNQTDYKFLYQEDIFENYPKVEVKKGVVLANNLLTHILSKGNYEVTLDDDNTVLVTVNKQATKLVQTIIKGSVRDNTGQPLPGANIIEKGTLNGVQSNFDGEFAISVSNEKATLVISYVGFLTKEVSLEGLSKYNIILEEDSNELEEIVVIGYGSVKKKDLTGAVSVIDNDAITRKNETTLSTSLQGLSPGVTVTRDGSEPGSGSSIRIRGITTIGNSSPLILVDGIPSESIDIVNPSDVENITILKDAVSASIYGARAAAGVILVTTKRGKLNKLNLEYSTTLGITTPTQFPGTVNHKRYMEMLNEVAWNDGGNIEGADYGIYDKDFIDNYAQNNKVNPDLYPITNWVDKLIKKQSINSRHNLAISYGNEFVKTRASLSYEDANGLYENLSYKRTTARINNDIKITNYLSLEADLAVFHSLKENSIVNPLSAAYKYGPLWAPYYSNGTVAEGREGTNTWARVNFGGFKNTINDRFNGKLALNFTPVENLTISGTYAPYIQYSKRKDFIKKVPYYDLENPSEIAGYINGNTATSLEDARGEETNTTKQLTVNYNATIGKNHNLSLLAGYEDFYKHFESLSASGNNFELDDFPYLNRAPLDDIRNSGNAYENAYKSYFGRVIYNYADKYFLQANIRHDGSSRFHKDHRWGTFPSISAGWILTEEPFIKNLNLKNSLSYLKFRASWGQLGNERIGNYPYQSIINFNNALFLEDSQVVSRTTAAQQDFNIRDISWETTESWNLGFDAKFLSNRLSISGEYYKKTTRDMLLSLEIPDYMGYGNPSQNAGKMHTYGWEIQAEWRSHIGELNYSIGANLSDYKSVMGNLSGTVFDGNQIKKQGSLYNEWYGYVSDGLFQSQAEIEESALLSDVVKPGDVKYKDISGPDGVPDGVISPEYDKVLLGGSLPRVLYSGIINLDYKGFDFSLMFQGVGKQKSRITADMVYQTKAWYTFPDFVDGNYYSQYNSAEKNKNVKFPRLSELSYKENNHVMSDYWLFDGSYFRLKNVTLGYTFPKKVTQSLKIQSIRLYASATDLFSIDNYPKGWDPEAGLTGYIAKTWNFGLQVKL